MTTSLFTTPTTPRAALVPTTLSIAVHIAVGAALITLGPLLSTPKPAAADFTKAITLVAPRDVVQQPVKPAPHPETTSHARSVDNAIERTQEPPHPAVTTGALDPATSSPTTANRDAEIMLGQLNTLPAATTSSAPAGTARMTGMFSPIARQQASGPSAPTGDTRARLLTAPNASYTEEAKQRGITGNVVLEVQLLASGAVHVLRVISPLGYGLDEAAITAVNQTRCAPAFKAGQPVDVIATITVEFKLT